MQRFGWLILASAFSAAMPAAAFASELAQAAPFSLDRAAGRLHVLVVHFPLALLAVAAACEIFAAIRRKPASPTGRVCLVLGATSAIVAALFGWFNSTHERAGGGTALVEWHRWLGVGTAGVAAITLVLLGISLLARGPRIVGLYRGLVVLAGTLVAVTGHFGGSITHGPNYLNEAAKGAFAAITGRPGAPTTATISATFPADGRISFLGHVKPILDRSCISCHSAEVRRADLRLDSRSAMVRGGVSGPAIDPGKGNTSLLIQRVRGEGHQQRMPLDAPALSDDEIRILAAWIDAGAPWEGEEITGGEEKTHWAYLPVIRPKVPKVEAGQQSRNAIDAFVLAELDKQKLEPAAEADDATLLRRVSLDLTGLPPTEAEIKTYQADDPAVAYERAVDRLLASPAYGERWATVWLDLARYGDSRGYEKDQTWSMWPYRDWVVQSLNADMPYDEFTIDQLAGDLLPSPSIAQQVATGFNRCAMVNEEGGVDPEEARITQVIDRVGTTATVWLGSSIGCAQCHDHKYDPFSQRDFYAMLAFFNNTVIETEQVGDGETRVIAPEIQLPVRPEDALALKRAEATLAGAPSPTHQDAIDAKKLIESLKGRTSIKSGVMRELPAPRQTRVLLRGNFLTPGDPIDAATPQSLPSNGTMPTEGGSRLDLAKWIVSPENPLTARVHVNRLWARCFGRGIVETEEDFGTRGSPPTHPELLDWLAMEFMASGWSQKHLLKTIVTSATYRQSSNISGNVASHDEARDPLNLSLARQSRFRLESEMIRDIALASSGLLDRTIGGPPVFPVQPPGVWAQPYSGEQWTVSAGSEKYRRGLYTFIKRAAPYPSMAVFDLPQRQVTCSRRTRSNTPLQALTTLNDPVFVEAAAHLAVATVASNPSPQKRAHWLMERVLARQATDDETTVLVGLTERRSAEFILDPAAATSLLQSAMVDPPTDRALLADLAAWTLAANAVLNLDEALTRE